MKHKAESHDGQMALEKLSSGTTSLGYIISKYSHLACTTEVSYSESSELNTEFHDGAISQQ